MKRFALFALCLIIAGCRSAGGPQTQTIDIPYPADDTVTLNLSTNAGQVTLNPADSSGVHGTLTTNVGAWVATTSSSGSTISVTQGTSSADVIPDAQNSWDLQVGKGTALILNHTNTNADTTFNLGGLTLKQISATATSGGYTVRYGAPPPSNDGGTASYSLIAGMFDAAGLATSHLSSLSVTTQGGDVTLSFDGGALVQDMNVHIDTQVGEVMLRIPPSQPAQVTYRTSSGAVLEVDPAYTKVNDITYSIGNYSSSSAPRLTIQIRTVVGDLRLAGA